MLTSLDTRPDYMTAIEAGTDDFLNKLGRRLMWGQNLMGDAPQ